MAENPKTSQHELKSQDTYLKGNYLQSTNSLLLPKNMETHVLSSSSFMKVYHISALSLAKAEKWLLESLLGLKIFSTFL